jgi:cobalt/nickel transport system permease protein
VGENEEEPAAEAENSWPSVNAGTSVSGIVGGTLTLLLAAFTGFIISAMKKKKRKVNA